MYFLFVVPSAVDICIMWPLTCDITTFVWKRRSTPTNRQVPSQHNCHSHAAAAGVDSPWAGQVPRDGTILWARRGRRHECGHLPWALCCRARHQRGDRDTCGHSSWPTTRSARQCFSRGTHDPCPFVVPEMSTVHKLGMSAVLNYTDCTLYYCEM